MDLDYFISRFVTKRSESMFKSDIVKNKDQISSKIYGKKVLVIGGWFDR